MDALRSVYHRAVVIPLENVESLWRELDAFENKLSKITVSGQVSHLHCACTLSRNLPRHNARMSTLYRILVNVIRDHDYWAFDRPSGSLSYFRVYLVCIVSCILSRDERGVDLFRCVRVCDVLCTSCHSL